MTFSPFGFFGAGRIESQNGTPFYDRYKPKYLQASVRRPGRGSGNKLPACSPERAASLAVMTRQRQRAINFGTAMARINAVAGGEPRAKRRAMARDLSKRIGKEIKVEH